VAVRNFGIRLGGAATLHEVPDALKHVYSKHPFSLLLFTQFSLTGR
jgi:hypothetical protein